MADGAHFVFELVDRTGSASGGTAPGTPTQSPVAGSGRPGDSPVESPATTRERWKGGERYHTKAEAAEERNQKAQERERAKEVDRRNKDAADRQRQSMEANRKTGEMVANAAQGAGSRIAGVIGAGSQFAALAELAGAAGPAAAIAAAIALPIVAVGAASERGHELANYSPLLARTAAEQNVAAILSDIDSANRNAEGMSRAMAATGALERSFKAMRDDLLGVVGSLLPDDKKPARTRKQLEEDLAAMEAVPWMLRTSMQWGAIYGLRDALNQKNSIGLFAWFDEQPFIRPPGFDAGDSGTEEDFRADVSIPGLMAPAGGM